jgi:hypothetical protein
MAYNNDSLAVLMILLPGFAGARAISGSITVVRSGLFGGRGVGEVWIDN